MNYIKALEADNAELKKAVDAANETIMDLAQYLNLPKFHCGDGLDGYVNVDDVKSRLILIKDALNSAELNL